MRIVLLLPLLMIATPVAAAPQPQAQPPLLQPEMADRLTDVLQSLSSSLMDLPIGEIEAAVEGRPPTPGDHGRTLRSEHPGIDRDIHAQLAQARPRIRQSMQAISDSLPAMKKSLDEMRRSLERAAANMPDPTYPKR